MILEYKFEYLSNNNNYLSFLNNILKSKDLEYKLCKEGDFIYLYIQDEEENLLEISNEIALKLPMSIFLKNYTLEVVSQIPQKDFTKTTDPSNLPYCSNCVANIENEYSSNFSEETFSCDICGTTCKVKTLKLFDKESLKNYTSIKDLLVQIAQEINNNKKVRVKTKHLDYVFSKFEKIEKNNQNIIASTIDCIGKLAVASQEKKILLSSVEKPSILFNINEIYKRANSVDYEKVNISLAKDLITFLLSKELSALGIDFVNYTKSQEYDLLLEEQDVNLNNSNLEVSVVDDKIFILKNESINEKLKELYNSFEEKSKAQFMVLLSENDFFEKNILNLYCSKKYKEQISLYSPKIDGMLDILNYKMPKNISEIFEKIALEDTGKRLIENYKLKFPKEYEKALYSADFDFKNSSISSLWEFASLALGFKNNILVNAKKALLQKGPRVDYKLIASDKIYNKEFDLVRFIKSGISFKLAGVDENSLSLGYVESFAYFLASIVDEINSEFELDGVSLSGDLIADEFVHKLIKKAITKNFKLFYNKDFPIQL